MTLAQQIIDDVSSVFLNTSDFAQSVTWSHWGGSSFGDAALTVIAEFDLEDETQGASLDSQNGRRITRSGRLHVAESSAVYFALTEQDSSHCDYVTIGGVRWNVVRIEGRDSGMYTFTIRRDEKIGSKQPSGRP